MAVEVKKYNEIIDELGPVLKALADPTRLKIMLMLRDCEQCTCHMTSDIGLTQGTISHHMAVLKKVGLVNERQDEDDARWVHYSLNETTSKMVIDLVTDLFDTAATNRVPIDCRCVCPPESNKQEG